MGGKVIKFYDYLLSFLKPFIIFWGKLHFPFTHKKITGKHYYQWRDKIEIGTVFLTKTRGELSNLINPTELKHAAIYVGKIKSDEICYVQEALGSGVVYTDLVSFLTSKDLVVGLKPKFIREVNGFDYMIHEAARLYHGKPYDYLFNKDGKAFYCFELVAACFKSVYSELQLKCKEIVKGKRIYDENTFLDPEFFEIIFDSRKE